MYQIVAMHALQRQYPGAGEAMPPFVARLISAARHVEEVYDEIMCRHGGNPSGIEFRHVALPRWAVVLPDASKLGRTRIQFFTSSGMDTHRSFVSLEEAVENMVSEGYVVEQPRVLDSLAVCWYRRAQENPEMPKASA